MQKSEEYLDWFTTRSSSKNKVIRLSKSCVGPLEQTAVSKVLDDGYLGMGETVRLLKETWKQFLTDRSYA